MAADSNSPDGFPDEPDQDWLVWFDLACDDIMVLETSAMTSPLRHEVEAMGAEIKRVSAPTRKEAMLRAFPKDDPIYTCFQRHNPSLKGPKLN